MKPNERFAMDKFMKQLESMDLPKFKRKKFYKLGKFLRIYKTPTILWLKIEDDYEYSWYCATLLTRKFMTTRLVKKEFIKFLEGKETLLKGAAYWEEDGWAIPVHNAFVFEIKNKKLKVKESYKLAKGAGVITHDVQLITLKDGKESFDVDFYLNNYSVAFNKK